MIHRRVLWCVVCGAFGLAFASGQAWAQEGRVYTVALYAPGLDFGDGVAKAGFVERAAQALSQRTGLPCRGVAFARAEDLQAQVKDQKIDFAILGGDFYAASGLGKPLAWASGAAPLALVARPGEAGSLAKLKGKTLILPPPGAAYEGFVTSTALDHEAKAKNFFKIKYTKDVESAVAAVNLGQADLTVALEPYALRSGLSVVYRVQGAGPLPVAVQVNEGLDPATAKVFADAFPGLGLEGPGGLFQGFGGGGEGVKAFRGYANGKAEVAKPALAPVPRVRLELDAEGADPTGTLDGGGPEGLVPVPAMPE